jgi:two-component system sensor histidine kinase PrrB
MRLSTRVALGTTAVVALLMLFAGTLLLGLVGRSLHDDQDAQLRERAAAVLPYARNAIRAAAAGRTRAEAGQQRRVASSALDVGVRLIGPDGTVLLAEGPQPDVGFPVPASALGTAQAVPTALTARTDGRSWRLLGSRVSGTGGGALWLFSPSSEVRDQLAMVRARLIMAGLIAAPLAGLLSLLVTERMVRPLRRLQQRTSGLDPRFGDTRLEPERSGIAEVDDLARTLQTVLTRYHEQAARTGEALATARAFAASASHELRTPLMSMRTNLDILAEHPELGATDRTEVVADLRTEHARLLDLLVALRALARGDLVEQEAFGPVDLIELADAAVREARRRCPPARIELRVAPDPGTADGTAGLVGWAPGLRMALDNLLANTIAHGHPPGVPPEVAVTVRQEPGRAGLVVTVDDAGPGIPETEREAVFQRFHRRSGSGGSGLGLTLVAQQVSLHGGTVRVGSPPEGFGGGRGTRIEVRLPRAYGTGLPHARDWLTGTQENHKVRS